MESLPHRGSSRLPGLDGLRAVSIALVLAGHLASSGAAPFLAPVWHLDPGNLGVRVFFVISGFLITTLLLEEHRTDRGINLRRFYFRRTLRIMPAYYAFLIAMAIASLVGLVQVEGAHLAHAAIYLSNYLSTSWMVGHSWSLSVEEQFYLLWPGALALLGLRRGFLVAAGVLVLAPAMRTLALHDPSWPTNPRIAFECVANALATGCLLASLRDRLWQWTTYRQLLSSRWIALLPLFLVALAWYDVLHPAFAAVAGLTLLNLAIALVVDRCLRSPDSLVGRFLDWRPVAFIGTLSYSIYLWQQPFLADRSGIAFPLDLVFIAIAALLSYFLIESPALRFRSRLERRLFPRPGSRVDATASGRDVAR